MSPHLARSNGKNCAGQTIQIPSGGTYTITLGLNQDHRDGVTFLELVRLGSLCWCQ